MFDNLEKFVKEGNPIKIFLSGARLRVVRSCEKTQSSPIRVYGESAYLSEALLRADRSVVDKNPYNPDYYFGSPDIECELDKRLLKGTVFIVYRYGKFQLRSNLIHDRNAICECDSIDEIMLNKKSLVYV